MDKTPYAGVRVIFSDLDGTLFPGSHEDPPKEERLGLLQNMASVEQLEKLGIPVIPATGNNVAIAQAKFINPKTSTKLCDLRSRPGIFCNGAYLKGAGGREVFARSLGDIKRAGGSDGFMDAFVDKWIEGSAAASSSDSGGARLFSSCCIVGLGGENILVLVDEATQGIPGSCSRAVGQAFIDHMEVTSDYVFFLSASQFKARAREVLSLVMLLPNSDDADASTALLKEGQAWLHSNELLSFPDASSSLSNGGPSAHFQVVCKHVHVPGIGPEIDISPIGVNKGSAIVAYLQSEFSDPVPNDSIAVFGDAGNDIELFGMKRGVGGATLEPLFAAGDAVSYRPSIRVAMPWANDSLLIADATELAKCHEVFEKIIDSQGGPSAKHVRVDGSKEPGGYAAT